MATYASTTTGVWFHITDPLGSRRILADATGKVQQTCQSLPFGDGETCSETPAEQLFTGKERDVESGNDYFGARYYNSTLARFLSPDWSATAEAVPYAKLDNPQSLNLYAYAGNNPIRNIDPDGHNWLTRYLQTNSSAAENAQFVTQLQAASQAEEEDAEAEATSEAAGAWNANYYNSTYRLVATSDTFSDTGGAREVHWTVWLLSSTGSVVSFNDTFITDPKFYVSESQSAKCDGCVPFGPDDFRSGGGVDQNQKVLPPESQTPDVFIDTLRPGSGTKQNRSEQRFWISSSPGLNNADRQQIIVRISGKDYGSLGLWTDGKQSQWIQGYRPTTLPGGNPPQERY